MQYSFIDPGFSRRRQTEEPIVLCGTQRQVLFSMSSFRFSSGARRRRDGVLHNLCFVPLSHLREEGGLMLVVEKYCITAFNYPPLCWTGRRLLDGFISPVWCVILFKATESMQNVCCFFLCCFFYTVPSFKQIILCLRIFLQWKKSTHTQE